MTCPADQSVSITKSAIGAIPLCPAKFFEGTTGSCGDVIEK